MLGIAIHYIQHSQAMLERGVCELAHSFFHYVTFHLVRKQSLASLLIALQMVHVKFWSQRWIKIVMT